MNIFHEIKSMISVRQVAESYGLKVNRNGMACCPFHNDKHPSMKIDSSHYYCFGCGVHGDTVGYVAEMFSLSQYDAACKIIQDFKLPIETEHKISEDDKNAYQKLMEQNQYAENVKKRFERWADETIDQLKESKQLIEEAKDLIFTKEPGTAVISNGFAYMLHQQEKIELAAGKPVAKELAVIRKNAKQLPSILGSEPSVKISEKDFNRLMDMAQASGTLEKLNEIYDRELEHMQGIIDDLMVQVKTWKDKVLHYDKFLNVKGLFEQFKEFARTKSIKERMEDKQKTVKTQKQEQEMKPVQRRKKDIAI